MSKLSNKPRTLIFSLRNVFPKALFRFSHFEFENIISEIEAAEIVAPQVNPLALRHRLAKRFVYHAPIALFPERRRIRLKADYELFVVTCGAPTDLVMLKAVSNWRDRCKTAVCVLDELWAKDLEDSRHFLRILKQFDVVMLYCSGTVRALGEQIGRRCVFLPPGIDTIRFCPYPELPTRVVDVYSIGRRSEVTHRKLLRMVDEKGLFYIHDSMSGDLAVNGSEHRSLVANTAKRSRYFTVNPGRIDRPDIRGDQIEFGNRYFEGAAAGAILLGERPENEVFGRLFDWPDALVHVPYNSSEIDEIIHELDQQPERQIAIQRANVMHSLLRHDWVYRWESILSTVKLEGMPQLLKRKVRLESLAESVSTNLAMRPVEA